MSLFHTREICSYQSESPFDPRAVCSLPKLGSIVLGTFDGDVNLYVPRSDDQVDQTGLVYAINLKVPILQIRQLIYLPNTTCVCVLTPRRIVGLGISIDKDAEKPIRHLFEHKMDEDFYSIYCGGFNEVTVRSDFIFALSLSGTIKLYQCDRAIYSVSLSDMLFPSPIAYLPSTDSVMFQRKTMVLCCYLQNNLAMMSDDSSTKKSLVSQWELHLPELILELELLEQRQILFVRGTTSVFMVNPVQGQILRQISVEGVRITTLHVFDNESTIMQLYGTEDNHIIIYSGARRVWSTSADCQLIGLMRTTCDHLAGCLLLLSRNWTLNFKYLGTRTENKVFQNSESRLSINQIHQEIAKYSTILSNTAQPAVPEENQLLLKAEFSKTHSREQVELKIDMTFSTEVINVSINALVQDKMMAKAEIFDNTGDISNAQSLFGHISFTKRPFLSPRIELSASAENINGTPMVIHYTENVPFHLYTEQETVQVSPTMNFSIDVTVDVAVIKSLFNFDDGQQVLLRFIFDVHVFIKLNSTSIRISGDCVGIILTLRHVQAHCNKVKIHPPSEVLNQNVLDNLDESLSQVSNLVKLKGDLDEKLAKQVKFLTAIEKNILIKSRDRNEHDKFKSLLALNNDSSESVTALRRAMKETDEKLGQIAIYCYAYIQLILLGALMQQDIHAVSVFGLMDLLRMTGKSNDFILHLEHQLSIIASLLGMSQSSSHQSDGTRIKKRLMQIIAKINPSTTALLKEKLSRTVSRDGPVQLRSTL